MTTRAATTTTAEALAWFDALPPVRPDEIRGRWRGGEVATGHPMDGALTASGWYGKEFLDEERVHPLLFHLPSGAVFPVDPRRVPMGLALRAPEQAIAAGRRLLRLGRPLLEARGPRARLREVRHRGTVTTAMVYDHLPIIDVFRRREDGGLLGLMDLRGMPQPFFFTLDPDPAAQGG